MALAGTAAGAQDRQAMGEQGARAAPSRRTEVQRLPERGAYDRATIRSILTKGVFCHLAFVGGGAPVVIPTAYGLLADELVVHGRPASRLLTTLRERREVCVCVTLFDGLVLAASAFEHSMNYRSVVVFGRARWIRDDDEKVRALQAMAEHLLPGRWHEVRPPSPAELKQTHVLAIPLGEASAKIRSGPPSPEPGAWDVWTGVLPAGMHWEKPVPATATRDRVLPASLVTLMEALTHAHAHGRTVSPPPSQGPDGSSQ